MQYLDLLGAHTDHDNLRSFAQSFFDTLGITDSEERESSNYVDGYYLKGSHNGFVFVVSLSDESGYTDLPYWIHITFDGSEPIVLESTVQQLVKRLAIPTGFRLARIVNYGKRDEQRIDF